MLADYIIYYYIEFSNFFNWFLVVLIKTLDFFLHHPINLYFFSIPVLLAWFLVFSLYFAITLKFDNFLMFFHSFKVLKGDYSSDKDPGDVTHLQAFLASVSGIVGLGNIAGVAVVVGIYGPGTIFWIVAFGVISMSLKYSEVTLGHYYRKFDKNNHVIGGAFCYLIDGLGTINYIRTGKLLAALFACLCATGAIGTAIFQSNQAISTITDFGEDYISLENYMVFKVAVAFALSSFIAIIIFGGVQSVYNVTQFLVPIMGSLYVLCTLSVIIVFSGHLLETFALIFREAFAPSSVFGGIAAVIFASARRSFFSSEAGLGSAPIVHSPAKTTEPVRQGLVAALEPLLDSVLCAMTGLSLVLTGTYLMGDVEGVVATEKAISFVSPKLSLALKPAIVLFAVSSTITWSYSGERAVRYLFHGDFSSNIFKLIFCTAVFLGSLTTLNIAVSLAETFTLIMAFPNLIGVFLLRKKLFQLTVDYYNSWKKGLFVKVKQDKEKAEEVSKTA